ncbi:Lsd90 protein [Schizosaccharomyces cryophilus OY26]|uniref:Lsd90 protein n=1 Tax=Schizosaccharomyces cryophilus (strain OY26 / ATCC MYA-4695 / CBS 11777 / NBRC 106824 / NRRL Y48691) TaxID=653667 RepID=S9W6C2_SCHCR|nr:Lsd90 protein [Schizosaccharomyces cryophilus OY26]EPY54109.1 Lsd90 protein [Schizosaccharomyces cryophilus OY26]
MDSVKNSAGNMNNNVKDSARKAGSKMKEPFQNAKGDTENVKSGAAKNTKDVTNEPGSFAENAKSGASKNAKDAVNDPVPGGFRGNEETARRGTADVGHSQLPRGGNVKGDELGGEDTSGSANPQRVGYQQGNAESYSSGSHEPATKYGSTGYEGSRPISSSSHDPHYTNVKITATQNNIDALTGSPVRIVTTTNARIQPDDKTLHELLEQRQRALREAREAEEELRRARQFNDRSSSEAAELEARAKKRAEEAEYASQRARDAQISIERSASTKERQAREEAERASAVLREAELKHRLAQTSANLDVAKSRLDVALKNEECWQAEKASKISHQRAIIDGAKAALDRANHDAAIAEAENRKVQYEFSAMLAELEERNDTTLRTASIREAEARNLEVHMDDTLKDARMRSRNATEQIDRLRNENKAKYADIDTGVNQARNAYAQYEQNIPNKRNEYGRELDQAAEALRAAQARFDAAKRRVEQFDTESRQQLSLLQTRVREAEDASNQFRLQAEKRDKEIEASATQAYDAVKAAEKRNEKIAEAARAKELEAKELYAKAHSISEELKSKRSHPPSPLKSSFQDDIQRAQSRYNAEQNKLGQLNEQEPSRFASEVEAARNALREAENNYAAVEREYSSVRGNNERLYTSGSRNEPSGDYVYQKTSDTSRGASSAYHYPSTASPVKGAKSAGPAYVDAPRPGSGPVGAGAGVGTGAGAGAGTGAGATTGPEGANQGSNYAQAGQKKGFGDESLKDDTSSASNSDLGVARKKSGKSTKGERRGSAESTTSRGGLMSNVKHALGMDK